MRYLLAEDFHSQKILADLILPGVLIGSLLLQLVNTRVPS
jgi:hypothetical protein